MPFHEEGLDPLKLPAFIFTFDNTADDVAVLSLGDQS